MLREYQWRGHTWQFDDADAPADAVPLTPRKASPSKAPSRKVATPKSATVKDKSAAPAKNKRARKPAKDEE